MKAPLKNNRSTNKQVDKVLRLVLGILNTSKNPQTVDEIVEKLSYLEGMEVEDIYAAIRKATETGVAYFNREMKLELR